jgi:hypothetical protein
MRLGLYDGLDLPEPADAAPEAPLRRRAIAGRIVAALVLIAVALLLLSRAW